MLDSKGHSRGGLVSYWAILVVVGFLMGLVFRIVFYRLAHLGW